MLDAFLEFRLFYDPPQVLRIARSNRVVALASTCRNESACAGQAPLTIASSFQRAFLMSSSKIAAVTTTSKAARCGEMVLRSKPGKGAARPSA
jgi:hypothetical protein